MIRDGISEWVSALAVIATVCEAFALEVRHGQRTEVRELSEPFGKGQKGSSAMPHKKNPIASERIAGLARIVRAQVVPVMEGIPLWHERDISHSSTERVALPDAAIGTDYLLHLTTRLVTGPGRRPRADARQPRELRRPHLHLDRPARAGRGRAVARGRVRLRAARGHAHLGDRRAVPRDADAPRRRPPGSELDEARLDEVCRPERYLERLGPVFDRLAALS